MSQARRCHFTGLVHLQPISSPFIFLSFLPAKMWTWSCLPSLRCLLFRWLLTFPFSFYSFTREWTLPPLQPRWLLPAVCRASDWDSCTIGAASVTCVGQQEQSKKLDILLSGVSIGLWPFSSVHRGDRVRTWGESRRQVLVLAAVTPVADFLNLWASTFSWASSYSYLLQ